MGGRGSSDEGPAAAPVGASLRLIATTDLHAHLLPVDYYRARPEPATGLAQAATLVRSLRAGAPGASVLLDNGDSLTGSLLADLAPPDAAGPHPMVAAMNALGYDAATLGNHDFDHGIAWLRAALAEARFPVVSANLRARAGDAIGPEWVILDRDLPGSDGALHRLRLGVLGLGPPQVAAWNAATLGEAVEARDLLEAAAEAIPRMRAEGADLVVALCHSGLGPEAAAPMLEDAAIPLAALPGLDALVLGHSHELFPTPDRAPSAAVDPLGGTLHGRPAVQPGFFGRHLGVIDLDLARGPAGWSVARHRARVLRVPRDAPLDPGVVAAARPAHRALLRVAGRPIGATRVALRSHFALVAPDPSLDVVADAKRAEARRLLEGRPEAGLPVLCAVSPFRAGGLGGPDNYLDIPPGPLALRQAADLYIYPNTLVLLAVTGRGLRDWLERAAALFLTLRPGRADQPLLDPQVPSYNADTIDGLDWTLDPSRPPRTDAEGHLLDPSAARVLDLRHAGRPVADADRFVLATSSYRLAGGGGYAAAQAARVILRSATPTREIVLAHVRAGPLDPTPRTRWRFVALPGTSAWFDTGPGPDPSLVPGRRIEGMGPAPNGFRRMRLSL